MNGEHGPSLFSPAVRELSACFPGTESSSVSLIANASMPGSATPIALTGGAVVRRASDPEMDCLKFVVDYCAGLSTRGLYRNPFTTELRPETLDGRDVRAVVDLPKGAWRFALVVSDGNSNLPAHLLSQASALLPNPIDIAFDFVRIGGIAQVLWNPPLQATLNRANTFEDPIRPWTQPELDELKPIYDTFVGFQNPRIDLRAAAQKYHEVRGLTTAGLLKPLGYFAIIESLIAHKPAPNDPSDSIGRQVQAKMELLQKRFKHSQPTNLLFGQSATESGVWKKLYAFRSAIAHGKAPDFGKELQALRDTETATEYLRLSVAALLHQSTIEPDLLADLQNC